MCAVRSGLRRQNLRVYSAHALEIGSADLRCGVLLIDADLFAVVIADHVAALAAARCYCDLVDIAAPDPLHAEQELHPGDVSGNAVPVSSFVMKLPAATRLTP